MRKHIQKLSLLTLLVLAVSCSSAHPENFSVGDEGTTSSITHPSTQDENTAPAGQAENTTPDSPDGSSNLAKMHLAVPQQYAAMHPVAAIDPLETAFENHVAALYPGWNKLTSQDQQDLVKEVAKVWKQFLGDEGLESFQESLKGKTMGSLKKFLDFEEWTIVALEIISTQRFADKDIEIYSILQNMESCNFWAIRFLQDFFNSTGNKSKQGLSDFMSDLDFLKSDANRLRDLEVKIAGYYGVKDYFNAVEEDGAFEDLEEHFKTLPDTAHKKTLPDSIAESLGIDHQSSDYVFINEHLSQLLQAVSFSYTDEDGKHSWSFFSFENLDVGGKTRGEFGAYKTKDMIFLSESEIQ
jgi:hypothetical protein